MKKENIDKVAALKEEDLTQLFKSETGAPEPELFDIQIPNRYGEIGSFIRKIDDECGVFSSTSYCRFSASGVNAGIQSIRYVDPDGGPFITVGSIVQAENVKVEFSDIYLKGKFFIVFYRIVD